MRTCSSGCSRVFYLEQGFFGIRKWIKDSGLLLHLQVLSEACRSISLPRRICFRSEPYRRCLLCLCLSYYYFRSKQKVIIVSTPHGMNHFYRMWHDAEKGKNEYVPTDVHWSEVPGRDAVWKEQTIANTSEQQFKIEFECEFLDLLIL